MKSRIVRLLRGFTLLVVACLIYSCGSGESTVNSAGDGGTGSVGILLTDAPADPDLFLEVNVAIESIELLGDDDSDRQTLYSGPTKTINLLSLKNESMPFSFKEGIAEGEYCKIRLTLSDLQLVLMDETPEDNSDNETYHPRLPGNNKLDLNIRDCFTVKADEMLLLQLDMDAGRSIHIVGNGKKYQFRPVVFVDVVKEKFEPRLLRLTGKLTEYDEAMNSFLLCEALPDEGINNNACVQIQLDEMTAFFDNVDYGGEPRNTDELFSDEKLETVLTVVGWPQYRAPDYKAGDTLLADQDKPLMLVDALVVERGEFLQVEAKALEDADSSEVRVAVVPRVPDLADSLDVQFQSGEPGINGTRFVSKTGRLLDFSSVVSGVGIQIDGVLDTVNGTESVLKAALLVIDSESLNGDALSGEVLAVDGSNVKVSISSDLVCGVVLPELDINLDSSIELLTVVITEDDSNIYPGANFSVGQSLGINGSCKDQVFSVESVVIINDERGGES